MKWNYVEAFTNPSIILQTGVLTKLLQGQSTSAPQRPEPTRPGRNRYEEIRSELPELFQSTAATAPYQSVTNRSNSGRISDRSPNFTFGVPWQVQNVPYPYRPSRPPPPEAPKLMCTRRDNYYVDFVPDVGQFRPSQPIIPHNHAVPVQRNRRYYHDDRFCYASVSGIENCVLKLIMRLKL